MNFSCLEWHSYLDHSNLDDIHVERWSVMQIQSLHECLIVKIDQNEEILSEIHQWPFGKSLEADALNRY